MVSTRGVKWAYAAVVLAWAASSGFANAQAYKCPEPYEPPDCTRVKPGAKQTPNTASPPAQTIETPTVSSGTGNPTNDFVSRLSESDRLSILGKAARCTGTYAFFQGIGPDNGAFWSLRCADGQSYGIELTPKAADSRVLECSVLDALPNVVPCFKKFPERTMQSVEQTQIQKQSNELAREAKAKAAQAAQRAKDAMEQLKKMQADLALKQLNVACKREKESKWGDCSYCPSWMTRERCSYFVNMREKCEGEGLWNIYES
jgi:hypothetical protein